MRALWSGILSFGLVNLPVKLYSASKERALKFRLIAKHDQHPITSVRVRHGTREEVPYKDLVRGYEYKKGHYALLTKEDFQRVAPQKQKVFAILQVCRQEDIPLEYYDKPYYLEPDDTAAKAYALLRAALKRADQVAIGRILFKDREHIMAIKPEENLLVACQLRYQEQIQAPVGLRIPERTKYSEAELEVTLALLAQLQHPFAPEQYEDTYSKELAQLIQARAKGLRLKPTTPLSPPKRTQMKDLLHVLRASLKQEQITH